MQNKVPSESFLLKASIAGGVCAIVSASLNGIDVTKIRMQNQTSVNRLYVGLLPSMKKIYIEEGIQGLMKGIFPSMLRELSYSSIRLGN